MFYRGSCMACWHHLKVGSYRTSGPSWDIAEGQWWREIFPVGRTSSRAPVVHFAWKKQVPEVQVYTDWWAVAKDLAKWSKTTKECTRKIGDSKGLGRDIWMDLLKGQRLWTYLCPMWMLMKKWSLCLENSRDGGAWWAAIYEVTQSQTRLKWLSSREWF